MAKLLLPWLLILYGKNKQLMGKWIGSSRNELGKQIHRPHLRLFKSYILEVRPSSLIHAKVWKPQL